MDSYFRRSLEEHHGSIVVRSIEEGGVGFPDLYEFLSRLLNDRDLPDNQRPVIAGAMGALCLPYSVLGDPEKNALAVAYLVASLARRLAVDHGHPSVVERNWPREDEQARDQLSELIRRGNEELSRRELTRVFEHFGFEDSES